MDVFKTLLLDSPTTISNVVGILPSANGGTGTAYFGVSGPTALRTYTFPNANATIARTDAAQTFTGTQTITAIAGLSTLTGGAGNMTITAGTGNSRTLLLQSTTSGGTATTRLTLGADGVAAFRSDGATGSSATGLTITDTTAGFAVGVGPAIRFRGIINSGLTETVYALISAKRESSTENNQDGVLSVYMNAGGNLTERFRIGSTGITSIFSTTEATTGGAGSLTTAGGIYATKKIICASTIATQAAVEWNLGAANVVSPTSPNRTITVTIAGTTYYIAAKTTND